jgi:HTH-type transcriptional regulator / antitoxin HigA
METLKYKVIKSQEQYQAYCQALEELVCREQEGKQAEEEIELLTVLIEKWDEAHNSFTDVDPIQLLQGLMQEHQLKAKELAQILGVSKGLVSDILHYHKGLSKEVIRALSTYFKLSQEAFNRPYKLKTSLNAHLRNAGVMNTTKAMETSH